MPTVNGTSGNDNLTGDKDFFFKDDTINGLSGNDTLFGGDGNDVLNGGADNDLLIAGAGSNTLSGGSGDDRLLGSDLDRLVGGSDNDFLQFAFSGSLFANGSAAGGTGDDVYSVLDIILLDDIFENPGEGTDTLAVDPTGDPHITLTANFENLMLFALKSDGSRNDRGVDATGTGNGVSNRIESGSGDSDLFGLGGSDTLIGGGGIDRLDGGTGGDRMEGGPGNDSYIVDRNDAFGADTVIEAAGAGTDSVTAGVGFTLSVNVEHLTLTGSGNINGVGNSLANRITGNGGNNALSGLDGNDDLIGGNGNDTLDGGTGFDNLDGGAGNDVYRVDSASDEIVETSGTDRVESATSWSLAFDSTGVENLTLLGSANINGLGSDGAANVIVANTGINILTGGSGNDTLSGGGGNDTIGGGADQDTLNGDAGNDTLNGDAGDDTAHGGAGDDTITGGAGSDTLLGEDGNDIFLIAAFADHSVAEAIDGGAGADEIRFTAASGTLALGALTASVETVRVSNAAGVAGATGADLDASAVTFGLTLVGDNGASSIMGTGADDRIFGLGGNDTLIGNAGNDTFVYAAASDVVASESINGVSGTDKLLITGGNNGIIPTYAFDSTALTSIETLEFTIGAGQAAIAQFSAAQVGTGAITSITGSVGFDSINVQPSSSVNLSALTFTSWNGFDTIAIDGTAGADALTGSSQNDAINGGAGADAMAGGGGDDTYTVDAAGDAVVEQGGGGDDLVHSSISYTLTADVESLILDGAADIDGFGNDGNNRLTGNAGTNLLNGRAGADTMIGGGGDDTFFFNSAADAAIEAGNAGTDTLRSSLTVALAANIETLILVGTGAIDGSGNELANTIVGNAGDNTLDGRGGNDMLKGAVGADVFAFSTALDAAGNVDKIIGFNVAADQFQLDAAVFAGLAPGALAADAFVIGAAAADAADRIIYNSAAGTILFDADGTGAVTAIAFATTATGLALANADFLVV